MNPERLRQIEDLYHQARERGPAERETFVTEACRSDADLKRQVLALLAQDSGAGPMERPVLEMAANLLCDSPTRQWAPGTQVGPYQIVSRLGEGGMGEVFKARDTRLEREVAIKTAHEEFRERFEREARAISALNHPNICALYDVGPDYLVMELVDGETLGARLKKGALPIELVLRYGAEIADALAAAHAKGIMHRDLKPANIMVIKSGIKVLDFGLAKTQRDATLTASHGVMGTPAYMAPEQSEGKECDARTDIYAFGLVLYEMATGRRAGRMHKPASELAADIPADLEKIIVRCMREDPERRFQNMSDVRVALLELKEESEFRKLAPAAAPARSPVWLGAAAAIVVVLLSGGLWLVSRQATRLPPPRLVPITTYPGSELYPSFSPDGKQIAFYWDGDKGENPGIYVKLLGETDALRLTRGRDIYPAWAPDGKRIAFVRSAAGAGIYTVSALGGAERKMTDLAATSQMSWSPDGKWLAISVGGKNQGVLLLPVEGGEPRRISEPKPPGYDIAPAFSPEGHRLAYAGCASGWSCDVYVYELDSGSFRRGNPRQITRQGVSIASLTWNRDGNAIIYSGFPALRRNVNG
jgi:eukaryotic-like serine/threonine-protein kinase